MNLYEVNLGKDAMQTDATLEQTQDGRNANKHRSKGSKQGRIHTQHKLVKSKTKSMSITNCGNIYWGKASKNRFFQEERQI